MMPWFSAMPKGKARETGFTLIELLMVLAIAGILLMVAAPMFGVSIRRSNDSATKAKLDAMRKALEIYHSETEGQYPATLDVFLQPGNKYLEAWTPPHTTEHGAVSAIGVLAAIDTAADTGGLGYIGEGEGAGTLWLQCTHTDYNGKAWNQY